MAASRDWEAFNRRVRASKKGTLYAYDELPRVGSFADRVRSSRQGIQDPATDVQHAKGEPTKSFDVKKEELSVDWPSKARKRNWRAARNVGLPDDIDVCIAYSTRMGWPQRLLVDTRTGQIWLKSKRPVLDNGHEALFTWTTVARAKEDLELQEKARQLCGHMTEDHKLVSCVRCGEPTHWIFVDEEYNPGWVAACLTCNAATAYVLLD